MIDVSNHPLASLGLDPVSDSSPCGENVRYDPAFEELEAELAKQESLSSVTVDWPHVADLSAKILKDTSKDLLVGAYLCQALLIKEGYSGLATGLKILSDMSETHWDDLFPPVKRMRARQTAITWLAEKAGTYVSEHPPGNNEAQAVIDAADGIKQLDGVLAEKMGDQAPMVTDLSRPLKNYRRDAEATLAKAAAPAVEAAPATTEQNAPAAAEPAQVAAPQASPPPAQASRPRPAATKETVSIGSVESESDAKKVLREIQDTSKKVISFWAANKLSDPRAYRLARMVTWMIVESAPPATDGVTMINPPAEARLQFFEKQIEGAEYSTVLPELEQTLSRSPFWISGQFKVVKVLRAMGGEYEAAAQTVIRETRVFIERIPEVLELSFADKTPFADDQAKMWISNEVMVGSESGATAGGSKSNAGIEDAWDTALKEASKTAAKDLNKAVALLNDGISSAGQIRDKFYWRCALADLLLQAGKAEFAIGLLTQMAEKSERYSLSEWEPDLLARIYNLLHQAYKKHKGKKKEDNATDNADSVYEQLCWFDPITALTVKGG